MIVDDKYEFEMVQDKLQLCNLEETTYCHEESDHIIFEESLVVNRIINPSLFRVIQFSQNKCQDLSGID